MNKITKDKMEEFKSIFKCINSNCDNNGTIANQVSEDEWEPQQCQYCDEMKQFLQSSMEAAYKEGEQNTLTPLMLSTAESVGFKYGQESMRLDEKVMEKILKELYNKDLIQEKGYFRPKNFGWLDMSGLAKEICKLHIKFTKV